MWNFLKKDIELQDKKIWKSLTIGIIYFFSVVLLLKVGIYFLKVPILMMMEYNISVNEISLLYGDRYILGIIGIMIIAVLTLPIYIALNRIKKRRKRRN